ncbi:MAG: hypothetical protein AABX00_02245 [Nanoarchaeota archaeon]
MTKYNISIQGMHCKSCKMLVDDILCDSGAKSIKIEVDDKKKIGKASFEFSGNFNELKKEIESNGYKVK